MLPRPPTPVCKRTGVAICDSGLEDIVLMRNQSFSEERLLCANCRLFTVHTLKSAFRCSRTLELENMHGPRPLQRFVSSALDNKSVALPLDRSGAFKEQLMGTLTDFILVDRDIFAIDASELWQVEPLETWVNGQLLYQKTTAQ